MLPDRLRSRRAELFGPTVTDGTGDDGQGDDEPSEPRTRWKTVCEEEIRPGDPEWPEDYDLEDGPVPTRRVIVGKKNRDD